MEKTTVFNEHPVCITKRADPGLNVKSSNGAELYVNMWLSLKIYIYLSRHE